MIALTIFIVSGSLVAILLVGQAIRLRVTNYVHHGHEDHPIGDMLRDAKLYVLGINRDSTIIFVRVIYRLLVVIGAYFMELAGKISKRFLTRVQANDVRKEKGTVSAYLKRVSHETEFEMKETKPKMKKKMFE